MVNTKIELQDLGKKEYQDTWDYQEVLFKKIIDAKVKNRRQQLDEMTPNYFLLVEHPHVYTLGKSGDLSNLLISCLKYLSSAFNLLIH